MRFKILSFSLYDKVAAPAPPLSYMIARVQTVLWGYLGEREDFRLGKFKKASHTQFRMLKMISTVDISGSKLRTYFLYNHNFRIVLTYIRPREYGYVLEGHVASIKSDK